MRDMKTNPTLPKHRKLMMESLELLFNGNKSEAKKTIKKAKLEIEKFYKNN
jgi:hypothetical protein